MITNQPAHSLPVITGQEHIRRELGNQLRQLREHAKMSRLDVIKEISQRNDGVALFENDSTLRRIEDGEVAVKFEQVVAIVNALDGDFVTILSPFFEGMREAEAYEEKERLMLLLSQEDFDAFEIGLSQLNVNRHRQFILFGKGALQARKYKNNQRSKELLTEALKLTLPEVLTPKRGTIIFKKIEQYELSLTEARICVDLASLEMKEGGSGFYELVRRSVERSKRIPQSNKDRILLAILFNLSNNYLRVEPSNPDIFTICNQGLDLALVLGENNYVHKFYYNIARYYDEKREGKQAKKFFQYAYNFCILIQDYSSAEKTFNWALEKYDMALIKMD